MRTTQEIGSYIPRLNQLIGLKNEPKWITLRFIINISLSFENNIEFSEKADFNGKQYNLEQITGFGKEFDIKLEYHLLRDYKILSSSVNSSSNLFEFLLQEFYIE